MEQLIHFLKLSKPIYLHGKSGVGKTKLLKELKDTHFISIHEINGFEDIYIHTQPSVLELFQKKKNKKICIIDDIDFLNNHEKKVLTSLLKQFKLEEKKKINRGFSIILSGTNIHDKKIKELLKICNVIHLNRPIELSYNRYEKNIQQNIRQIMLKEFNDDFMIENEKATQALLFHESIIDNLKKNDIDFYNKFLTNFCVGDYFDRISFKKQLWVFNEMSYYIKILHNYYLYQKSNITPKVMSDFRFTKVLTKYSNEYNNNIFINGLCSKLNCCKKDLFKKIMYNESTQELNDELTMNELNRASLFFQLKD
jgi:hypothetical protein